MGLSNLIFVLAPSGELETVRLMGIEVREPGLHSGAEQYLASILWGMPRVYAWSLISRSMTARSDCWLMFGPSIGGTRAGWPFTASICILTEPGPTPTGIPMVTMGGNTVV